MYRPYDSRHWYAGLSRKDLQSQHLAPNAAPASIKRDRVFLSDTTDLTGKIVIAKAVDIECDKATKKVYNYSVFRDYVELYHYIKDTPPKERVFHEISMEHAPQKARFDIDIEKKKYHAFVTTVLKRKGQASFTLFGDCVKDLVIRNVIAMMKELKLPFDISKDMCIFTSHRSNKRSYHIIINRYFHFGSVQAKEFHLRCFRKCESVVDTQLFSTFVDDSIYDRNHPLRTWHSVKEEEGIYYKKEFQPKFTFDSEKYVHNLRDEGFSEEEEDEDTADKLKKKIDKLHTLHRSLITCVNESTPFPTFYVAEKVRDHVASMSDSTYLECCALITAWDEEKIFLISGEENGLILLERQATSVCEICEPIRRGTGEAPTHDKLHPFCYIHNGSLYWHCRSAKGHSGIFLGKLKTVCCLADTLLDDYIKDLMTEQQQDYTLLEEDGTEHLTAGSGGFNQEAAGYGGSSEDSSNDDDLEEVVYRRKANYPHASVEDVKAPLPCLQLSVEIDHIVNRVCMPKEPCTQKVVDLKPEKVESKVTKERYIPSDIKSVLTKEKGKTKDVGVSPPSVTTLNFAQSLRQNSKCKVKYVSKSKPATERVYTDDVNLISLPAMPRKAVAVSYIKRPNKVTLGSLKS